MAKDDNGMNVTELRTQLDAELGKLDAKIDEHGTCTKEPSNPWDTDEAQRFVKQVRTRLRRIRKSLDPATPPANQPAARRRRA
jgi:hypothetical protein